MKKKLIGIFDTKKMTPEQIYEDVARSLEKKKEKVVRIKDLKK